MSRISSCSFARTRAGREQGRGCRRKAGGSPVERVETREETFMKDVTRTLARFVAQTQWEDIPPKVRHEAKRALVNYFAVALAGCSDPGISQAVNVYGRFSSGREAGLVGREE